MPRLDEDSFTELVAPYRHELQVHCYRLLGSFEDAEEALQDTLLSVWRHHDGFEGRSSIRTWLYRIATNRCLDHLRAGRREPVSTPLSREPPPPSSTGEVPWLQPYPDDLLGSDPADVVEDREALSLAYVRALQLLPPRQRVVLVLRDVLRFRAGEVAAMLETTEESVTSALKRARATLKVERHPAPRRRRARPGNAGSSRRGWTRSRSGTSRGWSPCSPRTPGCGCRHCRSSTVGARRRHGSPPRSSVGLRDDRIIHTRVNGQPAYAAYGRDPVTGLQHCKGRSC